MSKGTLNGQGVEGSLLLHSAVMEVLAYAYLCYYLGFPLEGFMGKISMFQ